MRRVLNRALLLFALAMGATALLSATDYDPTPTAEASGCGGKCGG